MNENEKGAMEVVRRLGGTGRSREEIYTFFSK